MSLIKGIHHVSMKCSSTEEYEKTIDFYKNILGIPVAREWQAGIMLDTGNGIVEILTMEMERLIKVSYVISHSQQMMWMRV